MDFFKTIIGRHFEFFFKVLLFVGIQIIIETGVLITLLIIYNKYIGFYKIIYSPIFEANCINIKRHVQWFLRFQKLHSLVRVIQRSYKGVSLDSRSIHHLCSGLVKLLYFVYLRNQDIYCWFFVLYKRFFYSYHYVIH